VSITKRHLRLRVGLLALMVGLFAINQQQSKAGALAAGCMFDCLFTGYVCGIVCDGSTAPGWQNDVCHQGCDVGTAICTGSC